jgi:glycosyltransferase involved in cell wall biosynthesis
MKFASSGMSFAHVFSNTKYSHPKKMPHNSSIPSRERKAQRGHPLIVQSHLRWDFVWQRPQQLLSRLASAEPVLFIEEPVFVDDASADRLELTMPHRNVVRAVPLLRAEFRGDYDAAIEKVRALAVHETSSRGRLDGLFSNAVQWFYTPMPAPAMLGAFNEIGVVYDCMDELSQFRNAPPDLLRRERLLMSNADVVFTGGYKLFTAKSEHHSNVHFFGCGVDVRHFASARSDELSVPADADLPHPTAGYFGVIDERLDYELIRTLAESHPEISVIMVGPTAKVNPDELPAAPNIHWLGQRDYDELPRYVKAFDVCLMPFALNEATEYINPTKTLEYMAAGKPIVSTAVADVVRNFSPIVSVANNHRDFIDQVIRDIAAPDLQRIEDGIAMASSSSWENIVTKMRQLITDAVDDDSIEEQIAARVPGAAASAQAELPGA